MIRISDRVSLILPFLLLPLVFVLGPKTLSIHFAMLYLALDLVFLDGPHVAVSFFQIFSKGPFLDVFAEYRKRYPFLPLGLLAVFTLFFIFYLRAYVSDYSLVRPDLPDAVKYVALALAFGPLMFHTLWQVRGLSGAMTFSYLKAQEAQSVPLAKRFELSQKIERSAFYLFLALFMIELTLWAYGFRNHFANVLPGYLAGFVLLLIALGLLPRKLALKKGFFLARLTVLPFYFSNFLSFFYFKATHALEYNSLFLRVRGRSGIRAAPLAVAGLVFGAALIVFFGAPERLSGRELPSTFILACAAARVSLTMVHIVLDRLMFRMKNPWVRSLIAPLLDDSLA